MSALCVPLQQSPQFARALSAFGTTVTASGPVVLYRNFGPFGTVAFASRATPENVAKTSVRILNGETPCPHAYRAANFRQIFTPAHIAEWDLQDHNLRGALDGKWRNRLVKGESHGLTLREHAWDGRSHLLFDYAADLSRKRGFLNYPRNLLAAYAQENPHEALIFEAYQNGLMVAACLILRHGATATYQTAWASSIGLALQAPRVVLWAAAKRMAALGHKTLDLGVVETQRSAGLARFKLGTGAKVRQLGGTWIRLRFNR